MPSSDTHDARIEFELHLSAQEELFSESFRDDVYRLGFREDRVVSRAPWLSAVDLSEGQPCPLTGMHVTWDCYDNGQYRLKKAELTQVLQQHAGSFVGYAHGEVIRPEWDISVKYVPFNSSIEFPVGPFDQKRTDLPKKWDIHISALRASLDGRLEAILLRQARMIYIDIQKPRGVARAFTVQGTSEPARGLALFKRLHEFLRNAGGMEGSIKFEQACFWVTCGNPGIVPPAIHDFESTQ